MRRVRDFSCGDRRVWLDVEIRRVFCRSCGKVKQESLEWLADNPFYTKRFAFWVGRRCRVSTIRDVARETHLDWKTIKALEKQYMEAQLRRAGTPGPHRDRRDLRTKGAHLPDHCERSCSEAPDLVRGCGPF
jgi:transposase